MDLAEVTARLHARQAKLCTAINAFNDEMAKINEEFRVSNEAAQATQAQTQQMQAAIDALQKQFDSQTKTLNTTEEKYLEAIKEAATTNAEMMNAQEARMSCQRILTEASIKLNDCNNEQTANQNKINELEQSIVEKNQQLSECTAKQVENQNSILELQQKLAGCTANTANTAKDAQTIAELIQALADISKIRDDLLSQIAGLNDNLNKLIGEKQAETDRTNQLNGQHEAAVAQINALHTEINRMNAEVENATEANREIVHSNWRMSTAWLKPSPQNSAPSR